ncbi:MAG: VCBS repeat-containing protein, partial [Myxococcales bacterium]|nr:VCBS repeat-containing protein [Myxococcales bacterium]
DGDGDLDVFVSGDGDPRTFWLEQTGVGSFTTHVIEDSLAQAGGAHAIDLDGDGDADPVFTGYEDDRLYVYER